MGNILPSSAGANVDNINDFVGSMLPGNVFQGKLWRPDGKTEQELSIDKSNCMLSCYAFTLLGLSIGLPVGIRLRNYWPMAGAMVSGSFIDYYDCYSRKCKAQFDAFQHCQRISELQKVLPDKNSSENALVKVRNDNTKEP